MRALSSWFARFVVHTQMADGESSPTKRNRAENPAPAALNTSMSPLNTSRTNASGCFSPPVAREELPVWRIVLTGGPCAGKSTLVATLQSTLEERTGVKVFCVPEAATLLVTGGLQWSGDTESTIENQLAVLNTQMALEDAFIRAARAAKKPALVVCDRGTMDGRAYCSNEQFDEIMRRLGCSLEQLRDSRYDAVIHLVSAAIGAESHYNLDNPARFEDVEGAKTADETLRNMYIGHPRVKLIDNSAGSFQAKLDRAVDFVYEIIGHTKPKHRTRRYLITKPPALADIPVPVATMNVTITVLSGSEPGNVKLAFRREQNGNALFLYYNTVTEDNGERVQSQHKLSAREYANLIEQRDPNHNDVVKKAMSFTYRDHFFELSVFDEPASIRGQGVIYVTTDDVTAVQFPDWLPIDIDTTGDIKYSTLELSRKRP